MKMQAEANYTGRYCLASGKSGDFYKKILSKTNVLLQVLCSSPSTFSSSSILLNKMMHSDYSHLTAPSFTGLASWPKSEAADF